MIFKQKFKTLLNSFFHVLNVQTNKQTFVYMFEDNTPKTSVCAPFIKLYKILLRFALGPLSFRDIQEPSFFFQLASGLTGIFHSSWINLVRE